MTVPCCPDRAGQRGRPYTAHWFLVHDGDGAIDLNLSAVLGGLPRSDVELARSIRMMMDEAGRRIMHGAQSGRWLMWDGAVYAPQNAEFCDRMTLWTADAHYQACRDVLAAQEAATARVPEAQQRAAREGAAARWKAALGLRGRLWGEAGQSALAKSLARECSVDEERLDAVPGEIVVENGRLSYAQVLAEGFVRLLPHDPGRLDTRRCGPGVRYEPGAQAPWFRRFLETSVPDEAQRAWLCWRAVNALFGRMPRKGFVNTIGERDSGKSTFTELIADLAGGYARSVPSETFLAKHNGDSGFRQAELRGARFTHTHEPRPGARYDESLVKTLTGRDRQRTAGKYEKPVEWAPQLTIFIGSNAPVRFASSDDAFMSRHEVIEFRRGYAEPDEGLAARMHRELPGVLNELLSYAVREAAWGLPPLPQSMIDARERLAEETEDALTWLREWLDEGRLVEKPDATAYAAVGVNQAYQWYRGWCDEAGVKPLGRKTFSSVVGRRYERSRSHGTWHFKGLLPR